MQGRILGFDEVHGTGTISGGDSRYAFTLDDWKSSRSPSEGIEVDFVPEGSLAKDVHFVAESAREVAARQEEVQNRKSKVVAGLLGIFLGGFGIHRFYLGFTGVGIVQIFVTIVTLGLGSLWGFVEGIMLLVGAMDRDAEGRPLRS